MQTVHRAGVLAASFVILTAGPVLAQNEAALRDYFEGKSVRPRIDMPATQEGIDVYPDARRPIDFDRYSARLKSYGVSIKTGESVMVTRVRVKEKAIEFQLGGGGYGTFGDENGSVSTTSASKTQREKDLERMVKNETDPDRKRRLQRELDDVRREREREDARNRAVAETATEVKKDRIAEKRLHAGSRFNIRYQNGVPPGLEADGIMRALEEYLEFPFANDLRPSPSPSPQGRPSSPQTAPPAGAGDIRKGMTLPDVEKILGKPTSNTPRFEGGLRVLTRTYARGDQVITAEFVEGVLTKYTIASK